MRARKGWETRRRATQKQARTAAQMREETWEAILKASRRKRGGRTYPYGYIHDDLRGLGSRQRQNKIASINRAANRKRGEVSVRFLIAALTTNKQLLLLYKNAKKRPPRLRENAASGKPTFFWTEPELVTERNQVTDAIDALQADGDALVFAIERINLE